VTAATVVMGNMHKNVAKFAHVVFEMSRVDRQMFVDRHTYQNILQSS